MSASIPDTSLGSKPIFLLELERALRKFARSSDLKSARNLISSAPPEFHPNCPNFAGLTPLSISASVGDFEFTKFLIEIFLGRREIPLAQWLPWRKRTKFTNENYSNNKENSEESSIPRRLRLDPIEFPISLIYQKSKKFSILLLFIFSDWRIFQFFPSFFSDRRIFFSPWIGSAISSFLYGAPLKVQFLHWRMESKVREKFTSIEISTALKENSHEISKDFLFETDSMNNNHSEKKSLIYFLWSINERFFEYLMIQ